MFFQQKKGETYYFCFCVSSCFFQKIIHLKTKQKTKKGRPPVHTKSYWLTDDPR